MHLSYFKRTDSKEIRQLFIQVFSDSENETEGKLIGNLVFDLINTTLPEDIYGYTATESNQIIGCIFFTRLSFDSEITAFILSPVAISTSYQNKGIGQQLINFGIEQLNAIGVQLLFTYGDPDYYSKVGFKPISENISKAPFKLSQAEGWLCQSLNGDSIEPLSGTARCVEALNKPELW